MSLPELQAFSEVLDVDNPDLFKWLTGQVPADAGIVQNPSFQVRRWPIVSCEWFAIRGWQSHDTHC